MFYRPELPSTFNHAGALNEIHAQCNPDKYFLEKLSEYEESLFGQTTVSLHDYHRGDPAGSLLIKRGADGGEEA